MVARCVASRADAVPRALAPCQRGSCRPPGSAQRPAPGRSAGIVECSAHGTWPALCCTRASRAWLSGGRPACAQLGATARRELLQGRGEGHLRLDARAHAPGQLRTNDCGTQTRKGRAASLRQSRRLSAPRRGRVVRQRAARPRAGLRHRRPARRRARPADPLALALIQRSGPARSLRTAIDLTPRKRSLRRAVRHRRTWARHALMA